MPRISVLLAFRAVISLVALAAASAALSCPKTGDTFLAWAVDSNGDGTPDIALKGEPKFAVVDIDDLLVVPFGPSTPPLAVESSNSGLSTRTLTSQSIDGLRPQSGQYTVGLINVPDSRCKSLLLQALGASSPSALVNFNSDGTVRFAQSMVESAIGFQVASYKLLPSDSNADGRDEIRVLEGAVVRGVMSAGADGVYAVNPRQSALAVWASFLAAASRGDAAAAAAHLSDGGQALLGNSLTSLGAKLPKLAANVVAYDATFESDRLVSVTTVVKTSETTHRAFEAQVVKVKGLWRIESF